MILQPRRRWKERSIINTEREGKNFLLFLLIIKVERYCRDILQYLLQTKVNCAIYHSSVLFRVFTAGGRIQLSGGQTNIFLRDELP
jgi:hypothetical protein